jgi:hypothetical protein
MDAVRYTATFTLPKIVSLEDGYYLIILHFLRINTLPLTINIINKNDAYGFPVPPIVRLIVYRLQFIWLLIENLLRVQ